MIIKSEFNKIIEILEDNGYSGLNEYKVDIPIKRNII